MTRPKAEGGREAEATRPVRTVFLKRGAITALHHHTDPSAWTRVVTGEMVDERWHRASDGRLVHETRLLRADQALAAPADLHRVRALEDTAFVTTCADDCGCAQAADASEAGAVRWASARGHRSAAVTAVGTPAER
ncbi:MAG: hypothetical protein KC619_17830 [Myxococcales bacterium]|nr:hypothetical protein [Myxococcales bacterium]